MTSNPVSLVDAVRNVVLYNLANIHTAMPGQVVSYDFTTQKADIQPTINKQWTDGTTSPMPILHGVPVIFPCAGGASLSFPVLVGDPVLLVVCERSITEWLFSGGQVTPIDPRKLDITDAVAIPGLLPFNSNFPARGDGTSLILQYAGSKIEITSTGAVIVKTATSLAMGTPTNELINQLFTVFTALQADAALWALLTTSKPAILQFIANMSPYPVGIGGTVPP